MKEAHGSTEENFNISCCICQKKFLLRNNLMRHLRNVHKQGAGNKHFCPTCGKQFYYKDDLKNHMPVHQGELKFKCSLSDCDKAYSTLKALKKHNKLTHEVDIDTVTCKICSKQLSTKFKLKAHMLVHSNAKPFSCAHCSETFKEKRNVVKHMRLKHMVSGAHKTPELNSCAPDNTDNTEEAEEPVAQETGESSSSKSDVVNDECHLNVNDVDQPDSTDPIE